MQYKLTALIIGLLMILELIAYSRTKISGKNNLFDIIILGVAAVAATILSYLYPSWQAVGALAIGVAVLCTVLMARRRNLIKRKDAKRLRKGKNFLAKVVITALPIVLMTTGWTIITTEGLSWRTGLLAGIPLIYGAGVCLILLYTWIKMFKKWIEKFGLQTISSQQCE